MVIACPLPRKKESMNERDLKGEKRGGTNYENFVEIQFLFKLEYVHDQSNPQNCGDLSDLSLFFRLI
jgi:hypothetical protein